MAKDNTLPQTDWKARLFKGYQQFRAGDYVEQKALYEELGKCGQSPEVMSLGVQKAVDSGQLKLQGAYFSIIKARLLIADDESELSEIPLF